jgi:PAS domain S-box-containing protein
VRDHGGRSESDNLREALGEAGQITLSVAREAIMTATLDWKRPLRSALALLPPIVALALAWLLWGLIQPHVWVLFYPAVFISCLLGGRRGGLIATALSTLLVWFLLPESRSFVLDARSFLAMGVFVATGVALALFQDRLSKAHAALAARNQLEADLREMTELHDKVEQLANERRMFAELVEQSSDFIGMADPAGKPVYLNPAGRRMVGLPADRSVEDTEILDYYPPEQRSFASDVILESMRATGEWHGETYFRHWQTGQAIPVSDRHFMIRDPATNRILGMATITRDISDLRKAQDELRRTNEELAEARGFLENVLESSTEYSIIAMDLERRVLAWNSGAARNYGYEPGEVIGRSSDMLHVPEEIHSGLVADLHQRALVEGAASGLFRRRRKDGTVFLAQVTITRRKDARGNTIGFLVVSHDVTAAQRHVREQQFLAEVGESLQASLDPAETIERIAQMASRFMGDACVLDVMQEDGMLRRARIVHSANEALATALEKILPGRNHPVWTVLETTRPLLLPELPDDYLRSVARDEEHLRLLETLAPRSAILVPLVARGRITAVLTVVSCRADRRYTNEDLLLTEELARRASLALDNARLYELSRQAIQTRDQVLGIVAHDLRNPLGTIIMQAALLRLGIGGQEGKRGPPADRIERAATRMNRIIQDLLDVTRMESGRLAIEPARMGAKALITESVEDQKPLAASASLELFIDITEDVPDVWADRDRLLQVFENLIGNAVKFTQPGGRIRVGCSSRGQEVIFWVNDTGAGIAAENLPSVFERHWQAADDVGRGAGLGLPIVKGIVEAHGGRIWVESNPGVGSTFFFTIPTAASVEERAA